MFNNKEAFEHNPKFNWIYNTTHLLDFQKIQWSPYKTDTFKFKCKMFTYLDCVNSEIFLETGEHQCTEVSLAVVKGEVKWMSTDLEGNLKLKIYSLLSLKMSKFTGVITFLHDNKNIWAANLIIREPIYNALPKDIQNKIVKVCNGKNWGHSDIHVIKEELEHS